MELNTAISKGKIVDEEIFNNGLKRFEAQRVRIRVENFYDKRTLDQNDALWRWNDLLGGYIGYTPNEMHYVMLGEIFGWKEIKILDRIVSVPRKTSSKMTTKEMSDYTVLYFNKAMELFNYGLPPFGWEN